MAVTSEAMLAPEEIFSGKGDIKEEAELTQEERKRRRAKKKRKFKGKEVNNKENILSWQKHRIDLHHIVY